MIPNSNQYEDHYSGVFSGQFIDEQGNVVKFKDIYGFVNSEWKAFIYLNFNGIHIVYND